MQVFGAAVGAWFFSCENFCNLLSTDGDNQVPPVNFGGKIPYARAGGSTILFGSAGGWPRSKTSHRLGAPRVDLHVGISSSVWELTHNAARLHKKSRLRGRIRGVVKIA